MDNQLNNGFCPKCGALLRDGVCPSCGFGKSPENEGMDTYNTENAYDNSNADAGAVAQGTEDVQQAQYNQNYYTQSADGQNQYSQNMNNQNQYNQNQYNQNGYNQNGYTQNQYGQNAYNQGQYTQNGYSQNQYTQNGYGQNQYSQNQYNQNGNYQNQYYQNAQGGYYNQNGYYGQQQKKGGNGAVIAIIVGGIVLLLVLVIGVAVGITSALNSANEGNDDNDLYNYDDDYNYHYDYDDDYNYDDDYGYDDLMDFVDDIEWDDERWKREPYNYDPEDVGTDYYYELCNCIDESVSYDMVHENYEELERENNVCIRINYYQLEGDIPNLKAINEALEAVAMMPAELYHNEIDEYEYEFERYGAGYVAEVESYITYNDEQTLSVTADIYYESATSIRRVLHCVNIDIETGTVLKNTDILDITDGFISDYREICEDQNGLIPALELFSDDEFREFLEDEDNLIAYYTPCGLEIGVNYETEEKYGWFSATLTDYEQYLKSY